MCASRAQCHLTGLHERTRVYAGLAELQKGGGQWQKHNCLLLAWLGGWFAFGIGTRCDFHLG